MSGVATTLLVVDDDDVSVMAVRRAAASLGLEMQTLRARDGREALDMLRGADGSGVSWPCVVLLDINMPRMTGLEFLAELRADARLSGAVVFVMTTSDAPSDISAAYAHQIAGYIVKSSGQTMLRATLQMLEKYETVVVPFPDPYRPACAVVPPADEAP